jgi:hypothetical protein
MSQAGIININGSGGTGPVQTLTGDSGGAVSPDAAHNINVKALYTNSVVGSPGTNTLTVTPSVRGYPITPYVVGPVNFAGYQTIQSAIDAANASGGGTVFIQPGTYTENLTLKAGVALSGVEGNVDTLGIKIVGVHTPDTSNGTMTFRELNFYGTTAIFQSSAAGQGYLSFETCNWILSSNGYIFDMINWIGPTGLTTGNAAVAITNCGDLSTAASGFLRNTAGMQCNLLNSYIGSYVGGGGTLPLITSGVTQISLSDVYCPVQFNGGTNSFLEDSTLHGVSITVSGTSTGDIINSALIGLTTAALTMSSSGSWEISSCTIDTSNNPAIAGAGTGVLKIGGVTFLNGKNLAATLTLAGASGFYPTLGTNGQVFLAATGGTGTFASLTSADSSVAFVTGPNSLDLTVATGTGVIKTITGNSGGAESPLTGNFNVLGTGSITVAGTAHTETVQLTGMTNHAVLVGAGTTTLTKLGVGTNGQVLIGATTADPAFATITSTGGTIAFTLGANTLNMEVAGAGFTWTDVTGATQTLVAENGYVTDRGGGVTYTLPASGTLGDEIQIVGKLGLATITPNANQQILIGSASGTVGATGTAVANNVGDCITLICITAGASTVWRANAVVGTWTLN